MIGMIVDDSESVSRLIGLMLRRLGHEAEWSDSAWAGLRRIQQQPPIDFALIDWNMPGLSGFDMIRAIRRHPRFRNVRLIIMSTSSQFEQIGQQADDSGADAWLVKPFNQESLEGRLTRLGLTTAQSKSVVVTS